MQYFSFVWTDHSGELFVPFSVRGPSLACVPAAPIQLRNFAIFSFAGQLQPRRRSRRTENVDFISGVTWRDPNCLRRNSQFSALFFFIKLLSRLNTGKMAIPFCGQRNVFGPPKLADRNTFRRAVGQRRGVCVSSRRIRSSGNNLLRHCRRVCFSCRRCSSPKSI